MEKDVEKGMNKSRFFIVTTVAWLVILMLDFMAHATILSSFWAKEYTALKSLRELFSLIPFHYLSLLALTILIGWASVRIHGEGLNIVKGLFFGIIFGGLHSLTTFFGWYSVLNLPMDFIFLLSFFYFMEILAVSVTYGYLYYPVTIRKRILIVIGMVFLGFVAAIILQNL